MLRYVTLFWLVAVVCVSCTTPTSSIPTATSLPDAATPTDAGAPIVVPTDTVTTESPMDTPVPATIPAGGELLFIQKGSLVAYSIANGTVRPIVSDTVDFATAPDGQTIAVVRRNNNVDTLWLVDRASTAVTQLGDQKIGRAHV